jgi:hypothetical protein
MVDSPKREPMADPMEALPERVNAIEQKLDALTVNVDVRFDDVTSALVEQRQYAEFAFDRLRNEMLSGFATTQTRFDTAFTTMATNFGRLERKLDQVIDHVQRPPSQCRNRRRGFAGTSGRTAIREPGFESDCTQKATIVTPGLV